MEMLLATPQAEVQATASIARLLLSRLSLTDSSLLALILLRSICNITRI
jgi:hypothetical protein